MTCNKGFWLEVTRKCILADVAGVSNKPPVYRGKTTKMTYEVCGDGFNYGVSVCDDGNTISGDGCSSKCAVEPGYYCYGGYSANRRDWCDYIKTELESVMIDSNNGIMLRFTRPVQFATELDGEDWFDDEW